ncbi:Protein artemis [Neolecta irregularis DAH-3]|uniref:Protein artemis n=1 Tax=Neolecta irregularis (strain DAH-3) TaxID=1198029 RepID=A0A1U7LWR2_NEOID|nr:Protein artemis [Neolecta irregularis DAH-3]|eukprot:OLL27058.1 Protein artemis [Neolecta irregularis DAH-3]
MFLIEGNGKAVLYTGDFRAETWWRNSLARNAALLPYLNSKVKKLDCIYLDTTFASKDPRCMHFISKTESAMSLVEEMAKYPDDTFFHFNAWTLGYEELWLAVANAFDFKIHVDRYRNSLFHSIRSPDSYNHGPFLAGYSYINNQKPNANQDIEGMLTQNPTTRFHSCEATGSCPVRDDAKKQKRLIQIVPYVTWSEHNISLRRIVAVRKGGLEETANILSEFAKERVIPEREEVQKVAKRLSIDLSPERKAILWEKLDDLDGTVIKEPGHTVLRGTKLEEDGEDLPSIIYIPYSRHSSLSELQDFVGLFRPTTVFPCVADNERLFYLDMKDCFANYVSGNFTFFNEMLLCQHRDSVVDSRIILERVLQEKWAYDDLDIDTDGEELSIESLELETSETQTSFSKVLAMAAEPALKIQQLKKELADDMPIEDTTKDPTGSYISSNSQTQRSGEDTSQESVFYYESETADPEKVEFWKEWIERGCEIKMSCVKWPTVEVEL